MPMLSTWLNPFNYMGAVKILPSSWGLGVLNAGPKALASKSDMKHSNIEDDELDVLVSRMSEDGEKGRFCNVYDFHGAAWGNIKSWLDRKRFLYMYDRGSVSREFQMSVAVCWLTESRTRQKPSVLMNVMSHFIGECVAAQRCGDLGKDFGLNLYRAAERAVMLGGVRDADYEASWVKDYLSGLSKAKDSDVIKWLGLMLERALGVAYKQSTEYKDSHPLMDVHPVKFDNKTVECWKSIASGIPGTFCRHNAVPVRRALDRLIREAPAKIAEEERKERDRKLAEMEENATVISTDGKNVPYAALLKALKII